LVALEGVGELRRYLDEIETESIVRATALGATSEEIASHMGITRQGAHYKMRFSDQRLERVRAARAKRGESPLPRAEIAPPLANGAPEQSVTAPQGGGGAGSR
jgi:hypothetical protein